ncbi:MAG: cobyrinic acid a,c-diamide synthase [Rhodospirillales bacterium RIFCSPLOWO2_12_FULL_58_28]|nr:MAG: cobyrinic acid a,c-diamide synthase [Rhodospirillales bacterium RIFCSPLOWO2_02_FULL_58_16]OHC78062.1 MAG: cobyrinic acid a,c-diamide synthase [Rhodospirillales bacterium RIFCSPLOWO2_12_FULL_58_28]
MSLVGGLIIAATASGSGKTVFTLGLLRHMARSGVAVAPAKVGPDYIDPAFHAAAAGRPCLNLDPWAMRSSTLAAAVGTLAQGAEIIVCEGVMGLFDGATMNEGSTADMARITGWPVILVVDARAQGASAAAVVKGFATLRPELKLAGVVFNRTGSGRHVRILYDSCAEYVPDVPVFGFVPRHQDLCLPERHLGLVQAGEHGDLETFLNNAADLIGKAVNVKSIQRLARPWPGVAADNTAVPLPPLGQVIAVADDEAFRFSYRLVIDGWRAMGCRISLFSPLAGQAPAEDADAVYLPGGYPELYAGRLAANAAFLDGLRRAERRGAVIFGECGGYMALGGGIEDANGVRHAMAGLLPLETSFAERHLHLGYRYAALEADGPLGRAGRRFRGHEFHYARIARQDPGSPLFKCTDVEGIDHGPAGLTKGRVMGSFIHLIDGEDDG